MGLFNPSWFCAHACLGPSMPDKVRKSVISNDGAIVGLKLKGNLGTGTGILIHRMLVLTTHGTLPSIAAALDADLLIKHNVQDSGNIRKRLAPDRFFITSPALGITVVACDWINTEALQPLFLDNANDPCLGCGRRIYLLGRHQNQQQNDLMVGDGRITAETETLIEFCADGTIWSPGSAGFDIWGNLAIMICDPKEHQMAPRKGNSFAWRKNKPKQFGITVSMIRKWLEENWNGGIEELGEPRISSTLEVESDREENTEISMNSAEPIGIPESKEQEQELSCISSCGQQQLDSLNTETEDILERREDEQNLQTASNIAAHQMQPRKQHLEKTRTVPTQNGRTTKEEFIDTLSPIAEQKSINQEDFRNITSHIPVQLSKEEETNIFPAHCWRSHHGLNESSSITPLQSRNQQCVNVTVIQAEQRCNGRDRENLDRSTTPPCPRGATLEILERSSTTERQWESQKGEEDSDESNTNHADYLTYQEKSRHILSELGNKPDLKVPDLHPGHSRRNQQHVVGPSTPARKREPQLDILDRLNANAKQWELQEEDQKEDEDKENFFLTSGNFAAELRRLQEEQFQDQSNIFSQQIQKAQKMECCDVPLQKEEAQGERDESSILGLQELGTENFHLETSCKYKDFQNPKDPNVHECIIPEQCGVSQDVVSQNEEESSTSKAILKKNVQEPCIPGSPSKQIEDDDLCPTEHFTDQSTIASLQNKKTQCEEGVDVQRSGVFLQPMKREEKFPIPASCKGLPKEKEQKPCSPNNHAEQNRIQQKSHGSRISALQNEGRRQKDLERSMILAQFKDPKWEMTPDPDMPSTPPQIEGKKDLQRATSLTRVRDDPKWEMELALDVPAIPAELKGQEELLTQEQFSSDQDSLNKSYELEVMEELADEMEGVLRAKAPDRLDDRQGMPDAAVVYMKAKAKKQEQVAEQGVKENEARYTGVDNSTENWTKWAESRHLDSYPMKKQKDLIGKTETSTSEQSEPPQMEVLPAPQISHPSIHNDKSPCTERVSHDEDHYSSPKQQSCRPSRGLLAIRQPLYVHAKYESEDCFSKASTDSDTESLNKENRLSQLGTLNQASSSSSCCSRDPETSDAETTSSVETRESVNSSPRERCPKKNLQRGHTQSSRGAANSGQPRIRSALTSCNSQMHPTCVRSLRGQNPSSSMRTSAECFVPIAPSRIKNRNLDETNVKKSAALVSPRWML